jgi:hypothetical protein
VRSSRASEDKVVGSAAERRKRHFSGDECGGGAAAQLLAMDEFGLLEGGAATKAPKAKAPKANKIVILE